nr:hypothetical protein TnSNPV_18 [Trichoplusia ni single nucleopolyhedrovirus]
MREQSELVEKHRTDLLMIIETLSKKIEKLLIVADKVPEGEKTSELKRILQKKEDSFAVKK